MEENNIKLERKNSNVIITDTSKGVSISVPQEDTVDLANRLLDEAGKYDGGT